MNSLKTTKQRIDFIVVVGVLFLLTECGDNLPRYSNRRNTVLQYSHINDTTLLLNGISDDPEFAYTEQKPILLGIYDVHEGARNVEKYLHALEGPNHQPVRYTRLKACCPFKTRNFTYIQPIVGTEFNGKHGMLERYRIEYGDSIYLKSSILYINLYDETKSLLAPKGFTIRQK